MKRRSLVLALPALAAGCGDMAALPEQATQGPRPQLPPPRRSLLPTVDIARATGWPEGALPSAPPGWRVTPFATGLSHPRWLHVLPNGDVLVAETNKPGGTPENNALRQWVMGLLMKRAGAGVPSPDRITLLRDADGDGRAEVRSELARGLRSPFGMALVGEFLYVANADAVVRFPFRPGEQRITAAPQPVLALPAGINHHWTKNLLASRDGRALFITVGSNSNVGENGLAAEEGRAAIWRLDLDSGAHGVYASGLRNPNGLAWEPATGRLWTVVNERDELGSDLVPDYLTEVAEGGFYGWPWSYWGSHVDARVVPQRPDRVKAARAPDYALGNHVAPLGLAFGDASLPAPWRAGAFIAEHGSWNRRPPAGYKVVFVPFEGGHPTGLPQDVLGGFLGPGGEARGRPVGLALDGRGGLLVADDVGDTVWRIAPP